MDDAKSKALAEEALRMHAQGRPGKLEIQATKPLTTQHDLTLAYSPGVAAPCLKIAEDPSLAYDYTAKGNVVAIISNGTAVLGLGDLGAIAAKPVMEGKAVLFKRFADVDGIDLEVDTHDVDEFVNCVRYLGASFGGINLEDIKAPECFIIEQRLKELLDIPVFHDDQHGTAIIAAAGLINAVHLTGRKLESIRMVINGAGAAGIACAELLKAMGVPHDNIVLCDTRGVIYKGRGEGMNQWKSAHAVETTARDLADALKGADVRRTRWTRPWRSPWRTSRSSSPWPTRTPRSPPSWSPRCAPTPSWPRDARTIRTRSTTSWAFPTSSAAPSTSGPRPSTWR
jgi:malate dehydrogenase (oxaloacetate-decarboxylating)(NADP+)